MKSKWIYMTLAALVFAFAACEKDPEIATTEFYDEDATIVSSYSSADINWHVTVSIANGSFGGELYYSTDSTFETYESQFLDHRSFVSDEGKKAKMILNYSAVLSNLAKQTTYYFYVRLGNNYSAYISDKYCFKTTDYSLPVLRTKPVTNITTSSADVAGILADWGCDKAPSKVGFCFAPHPNPTIKDSIRIVTVKSKADSVLSASLSNLTDGITYYVRAFAQNQKGVGYGNEVSFQTTAGLPPTVGSTTVHDVSYTTAYCSSTLISNGNIPIQEKGFCYNTSPNPTIDNHIAIATNSYNTDNLEYFNCNIEGLSDGTKYYIRSYAKNNQGVGYGEPIEFTTKEYTVPIITLEISNVTCTEATCKGIIKDNGGSEITECGICYSSSPNPTIADKKIEHPNSADLTFECKITELTLGTTYYVSAYAINSIGVGYGAEMKIVPGAFNVSATKQVIFSKGNLQYNVMEGSHECADGSLKPGTWRFAENQYDIIGEDNSKAASDYNGWIDLFGWGTSGWNSGANCYQPWSISTYNPDYYPGGQYGYENNLTGNYVYADWGVYNPISNGGNEPNQWRTLTAEEWQYVFSGRPNAKSLSGAATINGVIGLLLFPDGYQFPAGLIFVESGKYTNNVYTLDQWEKIEAAGAIFLPQAGERYQGYSSGWACYWTSSTSTEQGSSGSNYYGSWNTTGYFAKYATFSTDDGKGSVSSRSRSNGHAIRLVQDINPNQDTDTNNK